MVSLRLALLSAAVAVSAAPIVDVEHLTNSTDPDSVDRHLRNGELFVYGENRAQIVTEDTYKLLLATLKIEPEAPEIDHDFLKSGDEFSEVYVNHTENALLGKRDCNSNYQIVVDRTQRFVDWDVQMSPVVIGAGSKGIDVTISRSYSIANAVSVSAGLDLKLIKERLGASLGISYTRTWTTLQGYLIRGTIDQGYTGVVITQPWTNRRYGRTFQGCVGSLKQTGTFMADSREKGSYEGVDWVAGAITACIKKQSHIPLTRCSGSGAFN
ncbi:hypothetical protein CTRI78_v006397 [Colletotrichum trifolii]|uniref:Celp0028 effector like protein n=1 Tax=Colletotrichum trifolii TaxID=5466 RepID=A0A4R8RH27_COLTR|nr:hypothetical protein CTRI78_v006397 [Colletotrichum trifolii]